MGETVGVLSILEGDMLVEAKRLWKLFETEYGSKGVQSFDLPNVTFQAGQSHDVPRLVREFHTFARRLEPFEVIIDGLGYFESRSKVVFLKVQPTEGLRRVHRAVNEMLGQYGENLFQNYLVENWIPHVTVAMGDLTDQAFSRAMHDLREYHPYYRQTISNLNLVHSLEATGRIEIVTRARLAQRDRNA